MLEPASFILSSCSYDDVRRLQRGLRCSETLAWILVRRGVTDLEVARAMLDDARRDSEPDDAFHDPFQLGDMRAAVERIRYAVEHRQPIVVHGDYDCDGVCSTTLLVEAIEALGGEVHAFLPNRFTNGYGLQLDSVERFVADGARLVITVDCGITAVEPVAQAVAHGVDVIVCDHHQPGEQLPDAIICSTRPSDYPFPELCATAVAGKVVQALGAPYGDAQHELEAIATIADCVPLVGENRHLVRRGMRALRRTDRLGLRALLSACDLHARDVREDDVAFKLAPRINAVGRLSESERAYELLRAATSEIATGCARVLHETNAERRSIEQANTDEAIAQIEALPPERRAALAYVVSGRGWHEGVVGIVASRLVERYHRPVIVIAESDPLSRGSARSIDAFDMHAALQACDDVLVRWGGHTAAAGLTVDPTRIDELRERLAAHAATVMVATDLQPVEHIDAVVAGDELSMSLVEEIERLAPFGTANPRPRLLAVGAHLTDLQTVGGDRHLRCTITTGGISASAIAFGWGRHRASLRDGDRVDACIRVSINRFRGAESLQLEVDRLIPLPTSAPQVAGMCATRCHYECGDRVGLTDVLAASQSPSPVAAADPERAVPLEPLLALRDCVDLRHAGRAAAHVARLATAGVSQLVVCSDVSRRRDMLEGPLHPERLGIGGSALASERCTTVSIAARLRRLIAVEAGPRLVLCDYGALSQVLHDARDLFDCVVVLDPPVTDEQRDLLAGARTPLHLVFGAAETRFAYGVAEAVGNVRGTLAEAWRLLRNGPLDGPGLERALFGDATHLHAPSAVAHGIFTLRQRGLLTGSDDRLAVGPEHELPVAARR